MLARQLCQAIPGLEMDAAAHQREHAIEVELPLLARLARRRGWSASPSATATWTAAGASPRGWPSVLREREERPLLLISSDMNHFATDAENRRLDALALAALERRDPAAAVRDGDARTTSACAACCRR